METVLTVIHVVCSVVMIIVILMQSGKGSGLAASLGGASAGTEIFGGAGAAGFLVKATTVLGAVFMITSLGLAYLSSQPDSVMSLEGSEENQVQEDRIVDPDELSDEDIEAPDNEESDAPQPSPGGGGGGAPMPGGGGG